jgi:hypothetical protein
MITSLLKIYAIKFFSGSNFNTELLVYQIQDLVWTESVLLIKVGLLFVLLGSVFLTNFISTKNGLSKDSSYIFFSIFIPHFFSLSIRQH